MKKRMMAYLLLPFALTISSCSAQYTIWQNNLGGLWVLLEKYPQNGDNIASGMEAYYNLIGDPRINRHLKAPITFDISHAIVSEQNPYPAEAQGGTSEFTVKYKAKVTFPNGQTIDSTFIDRVSIMNHNNNYAMTDVGILDAWTSPPSLDPKPCQDAFDKLSRPFVSDSSPANLYVSLQSLLNAVAGVGGFEPSSSFDLTAYRRTHELALSRHDLLKDQ